MAEDFDTDYEEDYADDYVEEERNLEFEVSELKQKLSLLQKTKEVQRARYKKEMHMIVNALMTKHKELQKENHFLQKQVQQLMGGDGSEEDFLADLKSTIAGQKKEVTVLKKMVQQYESQSKLQKQEQAELEALQEMIQEKDHFIQDLEDKNQEFLYQLEAKDGIISRISTQVANMEAEVYALNKRARNTGDEKDQNYLDEMARLKTQITELQDKQAYYENLVREAQESRSAAPQQTASAETAESTVNVSSEADAEEGDYEEAMDMLLEELQENLSTYDQISSQFSKARV
jgi:chromosome segregation ATPase